ncbi:MAG: hypothetical protein LBT98_04475, partial [Puniceicoccales bacterium]|nr:hypothetical protein [Puniceicoccales bacterium]
MTLSIGEKKLSEGISLPAVFGAGVTLLKKIVTSPKFWIIAGITLSAVGLFSLCCLCPILGLSIGFAICFAIGYVMPLVGALLIACGISALLAARARRQQLDRLNCCRI